MTIGRRLDRLEVAHSAGEAIALWLATAHAYPTVVDYVRNLLATGQTEHPMARIARQLERSVRPSSVPTSVWTKRQRRVAGEVLARFELALALDAAATEVAGRELYRAKFLWLVLCQRQAEQRRQQPRGRPVAELPEPTEPPANFEVWRAAAVELVAGVEIEERARYELEVTYLGGASSLFPLSLEAWQRLREAAVDLMALAQQMSARTGPGSHTPSDPIPDSKAIADRVHRRVAELRDEARVGALQALGAHERADRAMWRLFGAS